MLTDFINLCNYIKKENMLYLIIKKARFLDDTFGQNPSYATQLKLLSDLQDACTSSADRKLR